MQIIVHTGAHFTDDDRLMKCLLRNNEIYARVGAVVPGPGKYRQLLRATLSSMRDHAPDPHARDVLMDAILDNEQADRVVLSNPHFFGVVNAALRHGHLYPAAAERMANLRRLFPYDDLEMFMAIRNPATFIPNAYRKSEDPSFAHFMDGVDPRDVHWSSMIDAIRDAAPDVPITVWCNEDTPMIWPQVLREIGGLEHDTPVEGGYDILKDIMSREGMARMEAYLAKYPDLTEMQRRRVVAAFLDKFAIPEALEEEIEVEGWTAALLDDLTERYDEDVARIKRTPGVTLIEP